MAREILEAAERIAAISPATVRHAGSVMKLGSLVARVRFLRAPRFKKGMTLAYPVPWDRLRDHLAGLSDAQVSATEAFAKVAAATGGWKLAYRLATISRALKGKDYGGRKRVIGKVPTSAEISAALRVVGR